MGVGLVSRPIHSSRVKLLTTRDTGWRDAPRVSGIRAPTLLLRRLPSLVSEWKFENVPRQTTTVPSTGSILTLRHQTHQNIEGSRVRSLYKEVKRLSESDLIKTPTGLRRPNYSRKVQWVEDQTWYRTSGRKDRILYEWVILSLLFFGITSKIPYITGVLR